MGSGVPGILRKTWSQALLKLLCSPGNLPGLCEQQRLGKGEDSPGWGPLQKGLQAMQQGHARGPHWCPLEPQPTSYKPVLSEPARLLPHRRSVLLGSGGGYLQPTDDGNKFVPLYSRNWEIKCFMINDLLLNKMSSLVKKGITLFRRASTKNTYNYGMS